jgi:serine/threonine protein kinase
LAALPTPDPRPDAHAGASDERLRLLRELGEQAVPAWAALDSRADGSTRLVVAERAERAAFEDGEIADWIRDARRLSTLEHPNVARVQHVVIRRGDVLVVSEFIDGVRWNEIAATATLETALRIVADTLAGLSAIHSLRDPADPKRQLFRLVHGALTPDCVIVGLDGVARIVGTSRPRSATARLAGTRSAYLAPEVLLEDDSADARADVYSVGVLLWEALSQRRFLPNLQPSAIVTQLLSGRVPAVTVPEASPWAAPLADVAMRALSADPEKRFPSAAAMSSELRRIGGLKLPLSIRVAAGIRATFADVAKRRREELERGEVRPSVVSLRASRPPEELSVDLTEEVTEASQTASTVPPPLSPEPALGTDPSPAIAIPPLDAPPKPVAVVVPPRPAPVTPVLDAPPKPVAVVAPPKPVPVTRVLDAPRKLVAVVAPPKRAPVSPAPAAAGSPQPRAAAPAVEATPAARPPTHSRSAPVQDAITAAGTFALATSAMLIPPQAPARPPRGMLRILIGGGALLAIGAATWWVASRGSAPQPAEGRETPSAVAHPAAAPVHQSATEAPAAKPSGHSALTADPATTDSPWVPVPIVPAPPNATAATPPSPARAAAPLLPVAPHAFPPANPVPARPKRSPGHRGYDPEGI